MVHYVAMKEFGSQVMEGSLCLGLGLEPIAKDIISRVDLQIIIPHVRYLFHSTKQHDNLTRQNEVTTLYLSFWTEIAYSNCDLQLRYPLKSSVMELNKITFTDSFVFVSAGCWCYTSLFFVIGAIARCFKTYNWDKHEGIPRQSDFNLSQMSYQSE